MSKWKPNKGHKPHSEWVDIKVERGPQIDRQTEVYEQEHRDSWDWRKSLFGSVITHYRACEAPEDPVPRSDSGSLIFNESMSLSFSLSGMEVDLLSLNIYGERRVVVAEDINAYLQGIFERTIVENIGVAHLRDKMEVALRVQGKSERYITGYFRGWDHVGKTLKGEGDV
jgi:hypothetical protein